MNKKSAQRIVSLILVLSTLLACLVVPAFAAAGQTYTKVKVSKTPTTVDTYKGVPAKYIPGTGNSNSGTYCCARYVSNFYKKVYGVTVSNLMTGRTPKVSGKNTVKKVSTPKAGDIYYQRNSSGSGHWAIVKKVKAVKNKKGVYEVQLIEQNWKWKSGKITYAAKNRTIQTNTYGKTYGVKFFRVYNKKGKSLN